MIIAAWLAAGASAQDLSSEGPTRGLTREELNAILTFRTQHLEVRETDTLIPGRITFVRSGWGWGPRAWRGYSWGTTDVITTPPAVMEGWAVYQGPQRLSVPEYLDAIDRDVDAVALERRIRRNRGVGTLFNGLAVAGLGAGVGGLVGSIADPNRVDPTWTGLSLGGFGTAILSGIVGGATRNRASKLAADFDATQELDGVLEQVRDYNEELRQELGLTPQQAYRELDRPSRRERR
jgi:hypothetical protein